MSSSQRDLLDHSSDPPLSFSLSTPCLCPSEHILLPEIILFIDLFAYLLLSHPLEGGLHEVWYNGHGVFLVLDTWHRTLYCLKRKGLLPALLVCTPTPLLSALPQRGSPDISPRSEPSVTDPHTYFSLKSYSHLCDKSSTVIFPIGLPAPYGSAQGLFIRLCSLGTVHVASYMGLKTWCWHYLATSDLPNEFHMAQPKSSIHDFSLWNYAKLCFPFGILAKPFSWWA